MPPLHYRLRIRDAADTADLIDVSTHPSTTHPYILTAPTGDGESFDPLTGKTTVGGQRLQIVDAVHSVSSRVFTRELVDAVRRWKLNGNKVYLYFSEVDPVVWQTLVPGYLTRHELIDALAWDVEIGETRYLEERYQVFKTVSTSFDRASNLIGSPVRGGFGPIPDAGPWRFTITAVAATHVTGRLSGNILPGLFGEGGSVVDGILAADINRKARDYFVTDGTWRTVIGSFGYYPRVNVRVETLASPPVLVDHFNPIEASGIYGVGLGGGLIDRGDFTLRLDWPSTHATAQPAVNDVFGIYAFPVDISPKNPLHVSGHPIDIQVLAYQEAGIAFDAASQASTRSAIGSDLWVDLRPTHARSLSDLARVLQGTFGYATRIGSSGERVFLPTRVRSSTPPVLTITKNDVRDEGTPFSLEIGTAVSSVAVQQQTFFRFDPNIDTGEPALDRIVAVNQKAIGEVPDSIQLGQREVLFEIEGQIMQRTISLLAPIGEMVRVPIDLNRFAQGIGGEIGDRYGRGAWTATHHLKRGIAVNIGDEIILDLDYQPDPEASPAGRGGQRVVQVVQRTPTPEGLDIEVVDSGNAAQVTTAPTFTLAAAAEDPKRTVIATITNGAALIAAGSLVRIEWATGGASRTLFTVHDPNDGTSIRFPPVDSGTTVDVGMRAENPTRRPSAYTTQTLNLTDLTAPTTYGRVGRVISWVVTEANALVEVLAKRTAETNWQSLQLLGAGSTSFNLDMLDGGVSWDVEVRHRDAKPLNGVSASLSDTFTPAASAGPPAPTAPSIWAGSESLAGVVSIDGTFGYDVTASIAPGSVDFEVAIETAVGSGVPGTYVQSDRMKANYGGRVTYQGYAPNDGRLRYVRAFTVTPDRVRSATSSTALAVNPWSALKRPHTGPRDITFFVNATGGDDGYAMRASNPNGRETDVTLYTPTGAPVSYGTVGTPASLTKTIQIPYTAFVPRSHTSTWAYEAGWLRPASNVAEFFEGVVLLPRGITMTAIRARLRVEAAGLSTAEVVFWKLTDTGSGSVLATLTNTSPTWQTVSAVLSEAWSATHTYVLIAELHADVAATFDDVRLLWVEIDYQVPDYAKSI